MHVGMRVKHPQYGVGVVKNISEFTADIRFDDQLRTLSPEGSELEPAEPAAEITALTMPLSSIITETVGAVLDNLNISPPDGAIEELGTRWQNGTMLLRPADATLQPKEVPLETFFHKIVMMRNNLRVLEQKINAHPNLSDSEKVDMQQYITKCYGSMTTFNILFKTTAGQFKTT